ncbi:MAG: FAD-binding oxidoreductase [Negativicutes bacterium]|nr:FAD-binding oxidoreductase [Negativicutes bacterium]
MKPEICEKLQAMFGDRATTDRFEREFYQRDVAPVPDFLALPVARTLPDIVIRPHNTEEVAAVMKIAADGKIPVTPRAGGSTAFFNSVCVRKGILLDLNGLNKIVNIEVMQNTVRVQAGITWWELERTLNRHGLATRSYPSSARSATVGGWLVMLGYGIGSLKYGPLLDQVLTARVVLPDGQVRDLTRTSQPPVAWLAASEGTLGIVTEVELKLRPRPVSEWHGLAVFGDAGSALEFINHAVSLAAKPFNLHFSDPGCNAERFRLGLGSEQAARAFTVAFDADGTTEETAQAAREFDRCLQLAGGRDLGEEARQEWEHRFDSFLLKREGPSMIGAEIWLPLREFAAYLGAVARYDASQRLGLMSYAHIETTGQAMVMTAFHADERDTVGFLQGLALTKKLQDIGAKHGAAPYGIGLWNTPYLGRCHCPTELAELKERKKMLDPDNIMNPGKCYEAPLLLKPALFGLGMEVLAATRSLYRGKTGRMPV